MTDAIRPIHPVWLRATHWLNALAVVILATSGWRIYNASPLFDFKFAKGITLGGWLGGAIQWHFAAMWLLAANGLVYLLCNAGTGRLARKFFPLSPRAIAADPLAAARGLFVRDGRRGAAGAVGPGAVEVGAVSAAARVARRLRDRAPRAFLRHGGAGRFRGGAPGAGGAGAAYAVGHDPRPLRSGYKMRGPRWERKGPTPSLAPHAPLIQRLFQRF